MPSKGPLASAQSVSQSVYARKEKDVMAGVTHLRGEAYLGFVLLSGWLLCRNKEMAIGQD